MTARKYTADTPNHRRSTKGRHRRARQVLIEALEERQLMSLTIEVRAADGTSAATVSNGQVLNLEILGVVTAGTAGSDDTNISASNASSFGINDVTGSLIATGQYSSDVAGNLSAAVTGPFEANGYQNGTPQDLNDDGNIDVGSNDPTQIEGYFFARHGGIDTNGTVSNNTMVIELGTLTYTVTNLNNGGETDINFQPRPTGSSYIAADWYDGVEYDSSGSVGEYASDRNDTFVAGTPFVVSDTALNPAPVVNTDNISTVRGTPVVINTLTNVTTSDALVTSSVTIVTQPTHGTLSALSNGSVTYTPTAGYLGTDSFTYHVTDANGKVSNTGPVDITVTTPPPPVAVADTGTTLRNQPVTLDVLANDTDAAPSATITTSSVTLGTAPADGTAVVQSDGSVLYTPNTGFIGTDTFTYTISDSLGDTSAPGTVTVSVTTPIPPVAVDDTATNLEAHPTTISVLSNDTAESVAIDPTTVVIGTPPAHGTAVAQADGTVIYTSVAGFTGPDTFTYTVNDVLGDVSNVATVSVNVTPVIPPTANDDPGETALEDVPTPLDVLSYDVAASVPLDPTTVAIGTAPTDGTAVPQADGTILYTSNAGFIGTDTFTYTVDDQYGDPSNTATVTVNVTAAPPPSASSFTAPVTNAAGTPIDVLANVTSVATVVPGSVTVSTAAANGTTSVDPLTGSITYTPNANFVGTDSFAYTVADVNGNVSDPATVTVQAGTSLSSAKGGARTITFVDATGGSETVTLNVGNATLLFSGSGTASTRGNRVTIAGSNLEISSIALDGTTKASSLVVRGAGNQPVTIGGITATTPLNSINARSAQITGDISVGGLASLTLGSVSDSTLTIGSGGAPRVSVSLGAVTNSSIISSVPITSLRAASWSGIDTNGSATVGLSAPSVTSIFSSGAFNPSIALSATGRVPDIASAHITGALGGAWTVNGSVGSVYATSTDSTWAGNIGGALTSLTIKTGGLADALTAGTIGSLAITGDLTSTITAASARSIRVIGDINGATLDITGAAGIGSLTASSLQNSTVEVGIIAGTTLATPPTAATLGTATIGSIVLNGRSGDQFSNSSILAGNIRSASIGSVTTDNNSAAEGIATTSIRAFSGIFGADTIHLGPHQLGSEALLQSYLSQQAISFGDFGIDIL